MVERDGKGKREATPCLLLNAKSNMLDPDIPKRLPPQPVASALGIEPSEEEIVRAMKVVANAKAVGPDGLSNKTGPSCWRSADLTPSSGAR